MHKCKYNPNHPVFHNAFTGRTRNRYVFQNENSNQDHLRRANFSQYGISYGEPYLWYRIIISENLAFTNNDSHQGFKYQLKQFLVSVDLHHLGSKYFLPNKSNSHI